MTNTIDLNQFNIEFDCKCIGTSYEKTNTCYGGLKEYKRLNYLVSLTRNGQAYTFPFFTGEACSFPELKDVLYCLVSDYSYKDMDFEEFCSELGYDEDSRKAEKTWESVIEQCNELERLFSPDEIATLQDLFQDY